MEQSVDAGLLGRFVDVKLPDHQEVRAAEENVSAHLANESLDIALSWQVEAEPRVGSRSHTGYTLEVSRIRIEFLGSGDAFGTGGRFQTCIQLSYGDYRMLLDCGASSLIAMKKRGLDPAENDAVVLSHLHGDHFGGLPFLVLDGQFSGRERPLTVAGPPGTQQRVEMAMDTLFPGSTRARRGFSIDFTELVDRTPAVLGPATVTGVEVDHRSGAPSYGLRVALAGRVVSYSGDTAWTDALVELAQAADLFVCEAYSYDKKIPFHLDYVTLMERRARLGCRRLVLTHLGPQMLEHMSRVEETIATDTLVVEI